MYHLWPSYHEMAALPPMTDVFYEDKREPWTRRHPNGNVTTFTPVQSEWRHQRLPQWYMDATGKEPHAHCVPYGRRTGQYHVSEFVHDVESEYRMMKKGWACVRVRFERFVDVFYFRCADLVGPMDVVLELTDGGFEIPTVATETAVRGVYKVAVREMATAGKLPGYIWNSVHPRDEEFPMFRVNFSLIDAQIRVRPVWGHFRPLEIDHAIRDAFSPTAPFEFASLSHNVLHVSAPAYRMQGWVWAT